MIVFQDGYAVTPHDTNIQRFRALWVGGAGNVKLRTVDGSDVTFTGVTQDSYLWVKGDIVYSTGTTATNIVALN